ncbi:MAG: DUF4150 domain-containing protein [Polyangiaceae bacterium]
MMPASSKAGGLCTSAPDVCKVPSPGGPVPTPFPNVGNVSSAGGTCAVVLIQNKQTVTVASELANSKGDEAGTAGGIISQTNRGPVTFKKGSSKVFAKGKKVVHVASPAAHNGNNANQPIGSQTVPSQSKVFVAS